MSSMTPTELARRIGEGLLSFPVTHFGEDCEFDEMPYRAHISWMLQHPIPISGPWQAQCAPQNSAAITG
jgi:hypothetical protein